MKPEDIRAYWEKIRREQQEKIRRDWNDGNNQSKIVESSILAVINLAVDEYLLTMRPQA